MVTPLIIDDEVFGVLAVSRQTANAFRSTDCEFLKQLGEHVALATHQTRLRESLEQAYDDLRQTQQAVLQQERLRAIGQMASGIAHDINNAISPVAVYTQSLLEREPALSNRVREYLETVSRVVRDVSATVGRMRDFYRRADDTGIARRVIHPRGDFAVRVAQQHHLRAGETNLGDAPNKEAVRGQDRQVNADAIP